MLNALSVDIEDWFQVGAFEKVIARDAWDGLEQRVEQNADAVLHLFDQARVKMRRRFAPILHGRGGPSKMPVASPRSAIARPVSRSTPARPGRIRCWRRKAMSIPPASRRCGTIIMAGRMRRVSLFGRSPAPR